VCELAINYLASCDIYIILNGINMKKKLIRLTESDLHRIIRESIFRLFENHITYDVSEAVSDALYKLEREMPDWDNKFSQVNDDFDTYCHVDYKQNGDKTFTVEVDYDYDDDGMNSFKVTDEDKKRLKEFINNFKTDNQEYKNILIDIIDNIEDYMDYDDVRYEVMEDIENTNEANREYFTGYDRYKDEH